MARIVINLSQDQQKIVNAEIGGAIQVLASAGTGKTRVLTERVRYIIKNTKKDGVIAITFTNKAADEMSYRLDDLEGLQQRCWIGTVHSVAQRILEQYGRTIGLPSELHIYERDQDRKTVFLQSLRDHWTDIDILFNISDEKGRDKIISQYMSDISFIKRELFTEDEIKEKYDRQNRPIFEIYQEYQEALLNSGGIDFDDILVYANRILIERPWCAQIYRAKYKHLCVDEAQDLNRAQYEFVKSFCGDQIKSVLMVGDPNQMIYGFNGSSEKFLCKHFPKDFEATEYKLKKNYRSSKKIICLANNLRSNSQEVADCALDGIAEFKLDLEDETAEATWIVDKIQSLLATKESEEIEGEISPDKFVIIGRNRFVFQKLECVLKKREIPYSIKGGDRHIEPSTLFGKTFDLGIRLRINPKDWVSGKKLCTALKITATEVWDHPSILGQFATKDCKGDCPINNILSDLLTSIQALDIDSPKLEKLFSKYSNSLEDLAKESHDEALLKELEMSLLELDMFKQYWVNFNRKGLGSTLTAFRNAMALGQLTEEISTSGLTLSTVHTMKGLEKDIVFLMGMNEGTFPDYRSQSSHEIEQERNNVFVAVTRSRRWIYITYPKSKKMPWKANKAQVQSRFITEMMT